MKVLTFAICCVLFIKTTYSQEKYLAKNGFINFFSYSLIEDITADNNEVVSIVDSTNKEIEIHALMKSFIFENSLMQEHFNENYMESDKFPKAKFKGKILNFDVQNSLEQKINLIGELSIHGVTKPIETEALLIFKEDKLSIKGMFDVLVEDYDIDIPRLVINNIAESIKISFNLEYTLYKK